MDKRYTSGQARRFAAQRGFSLLELMVTVFIVAILISLAFPSLRTTMAQSQVAQLQNDLVSDIAYARNEAVTRQTQVAIIAKSTGWAFGWDIRADNNADGVVNSSDEVLRSREAIESDKKVLMKDKDGTALTSMVFGATGNVVTPVSTKAPVGVTVCGPASSRNKARVIQIQGSGSVASYGGNASSLGC